MNCSGCGIKLQNSDKSKLGYTPNLDSGICERCFRLSNYGEYKKVNLNNYDFMSIINDIPKDSLIVYTVDILSMNLNIINNFDKVLVVVTKGDIIPRNVKNSKIINYIKDRYNNVIDVLVISSIRNSNIDNLYNMIRKYNNNKDVYFVGNTNTGKSTLINKFIYNYGNDSSKVTVSMYPSTTLDKVSINIDNITIVDTPGLIDDGSIINYVDKNDLKKILPRGEIKPRSCQISGKGSIIIDSYVRIDYESKDSNSIVIYTSKSLNIKFNSLSNDRLKDLEVYRYDIDDNKDLVIPGLGFIKIIKPIKISIYVMDKVRPYLRDKLI